MPGDEQAILASLRQLRPEADYVTSADFVGDGLLDSLDIVSLVADLEGKFGVRIDGVEIVPENFVTVATIASLVHRSEKRA